jgi:outer membrane autotransporter protein
METLIASFHVQSELGDARHNMTVTTASGSNFAVIGVAPSRDFFGLGTGVTVQSRDDLAFYGNYDALIFSNLTVHTFSAGLQYRF